MVISLGQLIASTRKILSGQSLTAGFATDGLSLCGIQLPSTFTGTAVTFLACDTLSGIYVPVYNASGPVTYTVAASRYVAIDPKDFFGISFLKIQSNGTEAADRTLICSLKGI